MDLHKTITEFRLQQSANNTIELVLHWLSFFHSDEVLTLLEVENRSLPENADSLAVPLDTFENYRFLFNIAEGIEHVLVEDPEKVQHLPERLIRVFRGLHRKLSPYMEELSDSESQFQQAWERLSLNGLSNAYDDNEPEYDLDMIVTPNPDYVDEGR